MIGDAKKSYVYLGLLASDSGDFFVKVGKTDHPERREKSYATHCPGGLTSMHAAEVDSSASALAAEARILKRMRRMAFVIPVGGEWFRVKCEGLDGVFDAIVQEAGEPFRVPVASSRISRIDF